MSCNKTLTSSNKTYYEKLHQNFDKLEKTHFDNKILTQVGVDL